MAYAEELAERIRDVVFEREGVTEKKMFGGIAFLDRGRMFAGVSGDKLMARVGKEHYPDCLRRKHVREMDFTGRPMQGYVYVEAPGTRSDEQLAAWLQRCRQFVGTLPAKAPQ